MLPVQIQAAMQLADRILRILRRLKCDDGGDAVCNRREDAAKRIMRAAGPQQAKGGCALREGALGRVGALPHSTPQPGRYLRPRRTQPAQRTLAARTGTSGEGRVQRQVTFVDAASAHEFYVFQVGLWAFEDLVVDRFHSRGAALGVNL
eukprot:COSAG01_NODE_25666_length_737_cov_2.202194_1_plen_149_part_00